MKFTKEQITSLKRRGMISNPVNIDRSCEECGILFVAHKWNGKFCTPKCRSRALAKRYKDPLPEDKNTSNCATCGNLFRTIDCYRNRGVECGKFCSRKCRGVELSRQNAVRFAELRKLRKEKSDSEKAAKQQQKNAKQKELKASISPCPKCGNPTSKIFCDHRCYAGFKSDNIGSKNIKRPCENCSKEITVAPGQVNAGFGKFCNSSCSSIHRLKNQTRGIKSRSVGGKREDLECRYFRSRWEANYARFLNFLQSNGDISRWEYEVDTFYFLNIKRGTRSYTPDFKVFSNDGSHKYIEVKGYMDATSKTKLKRMAKYYPSETVEIFGAKEYKALSLAMKSVIANWEVHPKKSF
jgi:hypothetical protein